MKVYITPEFIDDLKNIDALNFFRRVLNKTLCSDGTFKSDADDHRFSCINGAWIRYVSKGKTAYRVIYIIKNNCVYLYRAGMHSIEDHLKKPTKLSESIPINQFSIKDRTDFVQNDFGKILKTKEKDYLYKTIEAMYHVAHSKIFIISPFISHDIIDSRHHFGRFLDKAIEENTEVNIITRPPEANHLDKFRSLEERCIFVYFKQDLHAKIYIFDIISDKLSEFNKDMTKTAIIGSSNFTKQGLGFDDTSVNDELCYKIPVNKFFEVVCYVSKIISKSIDFNSYLLRLKRR